MFIHILIYIYTYIMAIALVWACFFHNKLDTSKSALFFVFVLFFWGGHVGGHLGFVYVQNDVGPRNPADRRRGPYDLLVSGSFEAHDVLARAARFLFGWGVGWSWRGGGGGGWGRVGGELREELRGRTFPETAGGIFQIGRTVFL